MYKNNNDKKNEYYKKITLILKNIKFESESQNKTVIPIYNDANKKVAEFKPITSHFTEEQIELLARWREVNAFWFPSQFKVTKEGTRKWFKEQVLDKEDRILFMLQTLNGIQFGHMGLYRFDFKNKTCEIDNVIRGEKDIISGAMTMSLKALIKWTFSTLDINILYLKVFSDNERAISLYERCGFKELKKIPLKKVKKENTVQWIEILDKSENKTERYFSQMYFKNPF